jgi:hypothetical protein
MKQSVQSIKRRQHTKTGKKKSNVARLRPRVVRQHSRSSLIRDKWERQADDVASRIVRAEDDVARILTPVPAASKKVPASRGEPLQGQLREQLESGFEADLEQVRIHNDAAAWAASAMENALAFTSGAHIYFARNTYDPGSGQGFMLLAHEVSHVLQQTGRMASDGVMKANDISGGGDIQRDWNFRWMAQQYRQRALERAGSTELEASEEQSFNRVERAIGPIIGVQALLSTSQGSSSGARALETQVNDGNFDSETSAAKSLLFDVLKIWSRNAGAAHLINHDANIETRYYPNEDFLNYFKEAENYGNQAIERLLGSEHPTFHRVWPYNLTTHIWQYLTQPAFSIDQTTTGYPASEESIWETYRAHEEAFIPNELYLLARDAMLRADQLRFYTATNAENQFYQTSQTQEYWPKKYVAEQMAQVLRRPGAGEDSLIRRARQSMRRIAADASAYWEQVFSLSGEIRRVMTRRALILRLDIRNLPLGNFPAYEFPSDPLLRELVAAVEQHTSRMFYEAGASSPTVLPQPAYAGAVTAFREALSSFPGRLSDRVGELFIYRRRLEEQLAAMVRWLGWAQAWIFTFDVALRAYSAVADSAAANDPANPNNDVRRRHRIITANILQEMAAASGNRLLRDTVEAVFRGTDVGGSYILLNNQWRATSHNVNDLQVDFPANFQITGWGITVEQLVIFYHMLYQRNIAENLIASFHGSPGEQAEDVEHLESIRSLREAYNTALEPSRTQALFPTRYENGGPIINYFAGDQLTLEQLLLQRNPNNSFRSREFAGFLQQYSGGQTERLLIPIGRARRLVLWVMPPFQALYDVLSSLDLLRELVPAAITDPVAWFAELGRAMRRLSDEQRSRYTARLRQEYTRLSVVTYAWRRRNITEEVRSRLMIAARHRGEIDHYAGMGEALQVMQRFSFRIRPPESIEPQMTLMMLDLADQLRSALLDEPNWLENLLGIGTRVDTRYHVITGYYGLINHAVEYLASEDARTQLANAVVDQLPAQEGETAGERQQRERRLKQQRQTRLLSKQSVLTSIKTQLSEAITRIQLRGIGFEVRRREGVRSFNFASTLPLREEMYFQGKTYLIDAIFADFNYFPPYAEQTEAEHASILLRVSGTRQRRDDRTRARRLLRYTENNREYVVTSHSRDDHHLALLARVIEQAAFAQAMTNLAEVLESGAELTMDLIELVPGFGQAFMVARMGVEITRFILEDLPDLLSALNDPMQMFNDLQSWFEQGDWLENMLEYVMFEAGAITLPPSLTSNTEDEGHARRRRHRGMDRVIHSMKTLGAKVLYAFELLQRNVRGGMVRAQLRLIEYRTLMRILELLPGLALTARDLTSLARDWARDRDVPITPAELLGELTSAGNIQSQIQDTFTKVVEGLHSLELPENIVPMDSLVDILMEFALDRFGRKGKLLNDFLQAVGARQALARQVTQHLVAGTSIDINLHWRSHFRQPLQQKLIGMQDYVINRALNPLITETLGPAYTVNLARIGQPSIGHSTSEQPEAQPYLRDDITHENEDVQLTPYSSGNPLSHQQRIDLESQFGHDLGYVRLHRDNRTDEITEASGAYALTSGSHIYLSSDVNVNTGKGRHILRHEIAHVLQQTGERPLSEEHDRRPIPGRPGRGLRHDDVREAAAERMANRAGQGRGQVQIEEQGGDGLYATPRRFVLKMFNYLSNTQLSEQITEDMQDRIPRMSGEERRSFNTAKSEARALWRTVNQKVRSAETGIHFDAPFEQGRSLIAAALGTVYDDAARAIDALTFRSARQLANGQYRLRVGTFLNQLRTYIYGRTGVVLSIAEAGDRVGRIRVTYIHLGNTPTNYSIWTDPSAGVKRNTRAHANDQQRDLIQGNWPRAREFIRSLQYQSRHVWHASQFRLHDTFIAELAELFHVPPDERVEIGTWQNYTTPALSGNERRVGLRVATHGQLTARASSTPPPVPAGVVRQVGPNILDVAKRGRESHHIPQYLLVEYFRNEARTELFSGSRRLPGFSASGGRITAFNGGSGQQINLNDLDPGGRSNRGLNLPAISIAERTHQRGQLHVNQTSTWSKALESEASDTGTRTQSMWLDYYFYQQLDNATRSAAPAAGSGRSKNDIIDRVRGMPEAAAKTAIYQAMKASYNTMYSNMMDMLQPGLANYEVDYYRDIAMAHRDQTMRNDQLLDPYIPEESRLAQPFRAVRELNERIMSQWR